MPLRCLIVDDNKPFLVAARALLEREGLIVAGVASSGAEALQQAETLRPDVVLVDISLRDESGLEVARRLRESLGDEAVMILISTRAEEEIVDLIAGPPAAAL